MVKTDRSANGAVDRFSFCNACWHTVDVQHSFARQTTSLTISCATLSGSQSIALGMMLLPHVWARGMYLEEPPRPLKWTSV